MKRIITCSDGTWNRPNATDGGKPVRTNVQKIFDYINKHDGQGIAQIKYYDEGIGAEGSFISRAFDGATGDGIDENILDAYKFIVWNYEPGDDIYLFGFSRGAYTARSLAGLLRKCGILRKSDLNLIKAVYDLYRDSAKPEDPKAKTFRNTYSFDVTHIKFIGVWDTVGALGIPVHAFQKWNREKYSFHDAKLSSIIENAYHALAVDERRSTFAPTLWEKSDNTTPRDFVQTQEQRWFAGVHSNVGGGYPDEGLADITLQWMISKAKLSGLAFDDDAIVLDVKPNVCGKLYDSRDGIFKLTKDLLRETSAPGTVIDESVFKRMENCVGYNPPNVKKPGT